MFPASPPTLSGALKRRCSESDDMLVDTQPENPTLTDRRFDDLPVRDPAEPLAQPDGRPPCKQSKSEFSPVVTNAVAPPPDLLQTRIDRLLPTEWLQRDIAAITAALATGGDDPRPEALALSMVGAQICLTSPKPLPRELEIALMPRLIGTLLAAGVIDPRHGAVARQAAARISEYAALSSHPPQAGDNAETLPRPRSPFERLALRRAIDPAALRRLLDDREQWPDLVFRSSGSGALPLEMFPKIEQGLLALCDTMETSRYLPEELCAALRRQLPAIVRAGARQDRYEHNEPDGLVIRYLGIPYPGRPRAP